MNSTNLTFQTYIDLFKNITHTNIAALVISIVAIIFLLLCKEFLDKFVQRKFRVPIPSELIVVSCTVVFKYRNVLL